MPKKQPPIDIPNNKPWWLPWSVGILWATATLIHDNTPTLATGIAKLFQSGSFRPAFNLNGKVAPTFYRQKGFSINEPRWVIFALYHPTAPRWAQFIGTKAPPPAPGFVQVRAGVKRGIPIKDKKGTTFITRTFK